MSPENLTGKWSIRFVAQMIRKETTKLGGKNSMKKLLIAMLVGLLLIGAASATPNVNDYNKNKNHHKDIGIASSCANAFSMGTAYVDKCVVSGSCKDLDIATQSLASTWQIDDAKVDPISASLSIGFASSTVKGEIDVGSKWHNEEVTADMSAASLSTAFNFARGSDIATGSTNTFNIANNCITDRALTSTSIACSSSTGFAMGEADPHCDGKIDDMYMSEMPEA